MSMCLEATLSGGRGEGKSGSPLDLRNPVLPRNLARMAGTLIKMPVPGPVPATGFWKF